MLQLRTRGALDGGDHGRGVDTRTTHCNNSLERKMEKSNRYLPLLGRVLIGAPFILSGLSKLVAHDATVGYISSVGLAFPQLAWLLAMAVEMGGGALLLIGYRARPVALIVALFALATAIFFHRNFTDQNQLIHFLKNIMIVGGLLQIVYFGAGPMSIDASRKQSHS
jgi:putative oxidoreductase